MDSWNQQPVILVYTITDGLGDYLVMGDLMRKAKALLPMAKTLMIHRANNHSKLWPDGNFQESFFNIYSPLAEAIRSGNIPSLVMSKLRSILLLALIMFSNLIPSPFSMAVTIYS